MEEQMRCLLYSFSAEYVARTVMVRDGERERERDGERETWGERE